MTLTRASYAECLGANINSKSPFINQCPFLLKRGGNLNLRFLPRSWKEFKSEAERLGK